MNRRRTDLRCEVAQREAWRPDVGTIGAGDSLVIDSVSEDQLHRLPAAIGSFLLRSFHCGYCPPIPALRRLGFRTRRELEEERTARLSACWRW
jgi:hypothetical protein